MTAHHSWLKALLVVVSVPHMVRAQQAIAIITGTVSVGTDGTKGGSPSVFGFAPGTSLANQKFSLTYSFDGAKGKQNVTTCCAAPPVPVKSDLSGAGDASPGTAVLQIGTGAFAFGPSVDGTAETWLSGPLIGSRAYYYVSTQDATNDSSVYAYLYPSDGTPLTSNVTWSAAFSASISGVSGFWISAKTDKGYQTAWGELNLENISVSGPLDCSAGSFTPPAASGGVPHHYVVEHVICPTILPSCTSQQVFSTLELFPTDPLPRGLPVKTCDVTDIPQIGPVITYVDPANFSVTNVTLPGHQFYPGQVTRSVIKNNGEIYIQTIGTGTGAWPWVNENAADIYWGTVDAVIRSLFMPTF